MCARTVLDTTLLSRPSGRDIGTHRRQCVGGIRVTVGQVSVIVVRDARQCRRDGRAVGLDARFCRGMPAPDVSNNGRRIDSHFKPVWLISGQQFREPEPEGGVLGGVVPRSRTDGSAQTSELVTCWVRDNSTRTGGTRVAARTALYTTTEIVIIAS